MKKSIELHNTSLVSNTCLPMGGSVLRNPMLHQVEGVNARVLIVKAHSGQEYNLITDFGHQINCKVMHLSLCAIFLLWVLIL